MLGDLLTRLGLVGLGVRLSLGMALAVEVAGGVAVGVDVGVDVGDAVAVPAGTCNPFAPHSKVKKRVPL